MPQVPVPPNPGIRAGPESYRPGVPESPYPDPDLSIPPMPLSAAVTEGLVDILGPNAVSRSRRT